MGSGRIVVVPDSPMEKPGGVLHIVNGPVFSAVVNGWGADCSCGWKTSNHTYSFVEWALTQHRRVAAGFRTKRRRERVRDEEAVSGSKMKACPACTEKVPASYVWCSFCGFRFDSV